MDVSISDSGAPVFSGERPQYAPRFTPSCIARIPDAGLAALELQLKCVDSVDTIY